MQRILFIIFISFFCLLSCAKQKPDGVLSEDKMTKLMTEVSLIDAYLNTLPIDSGRKVMHVLYDNVFKEFDIDSTVYKQNIAFYYGNPMLTEKLYTNVQKQLMDYDKELGKEDSIRNAFVQDSISRISRLQQLHAERSNLTMHYYRDSSAYTYKQDGLTFLNKSKLNLNAYGTQIPAITTWTPETTSNQSTKVENDYILNSSKDSTEYVYKLVSLGFLEKSGLNLNAYGIQVPTIIVPVFNAPIPKPTEVSPDSTTAVGEELPVLEERAPVEVNENKVDPKPVKENIIQKDLPRQKIPKKLQIQQTH